MEILKDRRFENLSDMKHEPRKFGWRKLLLFLIYAKLLPYTISDGESQTPLLRFLLRGGGGSAHRIGLYKMRMACLRTICNWPLQRRALW